MFPPQVRLQVQPTDKPRYYQGMLSGLRRSYVEDGLWRGLYEPGLAATVLRGFTYTGFRIGLYPTVRDYILSVTEHEGSSPPLLSRIAAGSVTGAISASVFCPIDVIRVRLQAQAGTFGEQWPHDDGAQGWIASTVFDHLGGNPRRFHRASGHQRGLAGCDSDSSARGWTLWVSIVVL